MASIYHPGETLLQGYLSDLSFTPNKETGKSPEREERCLMDIHWQISRELYLQRPSFVQNELHNIRMAK